MILLFLSCLHPSPDKPSPTRTTPPDSTQPPDSTDPPPHWDDNPCQGIDPSTSSFGPTVATFQAEDTLSPPDPGGLVVTGSSSIRRWEGAFESLAPWGPVQRGMGGAWSSDIAAFAPALVLAYKPKAVLTFAGTNDLAGGATAEEVTTRYRCLVQQVWEGLGDIPLFYIGVTPAPSRWENWSEAQKANQLISSLGTDHPNLHYIDTPAALLQTGEPPDLSLFVEDQLHLSESGYALWTSVILQELRRVLPERTPPSNSLAPPPGTRVLVDLGPSNPDDGAPVQNPDSFGHTWNSWGPLEGGAQVLAGEALGLRDVKGAPTGYRLVITGGFLNNGLQNGGLLDPDSSRLGDLAVPAAAEDYFYTDGPDNPGGFAITGLDPAQRYSLTLFGSRDWGDENRVTRYTVSGVGSQTLQTSGPGLGSAGSPNGNTSSVVRFSGLHPDKWGQIYVDVSIEQGTFAYLGLIDLQVEAAQPLPPSPPTQ